MTAHWFLLREMVKRDFNSRYAGSIGGFLWSLLQPLWTLLLFTWIFSVIIKFDLAGELTQNFAIYLFAGLIPWLAFNEGVSRSATAIVDNGDLVKKVRFPAELLIVSIVLGSLIHSAIASVVYLVVLLSLGEFSIRGVYLLFLALPLQLALTLGLGLLVAALQVFFRDVAQLLVMLLNGWFYFTPIVFPLSPLPEKLQHALAYNPLTPLVGLYRGGFLGGELGPLVQYLPLAVASVLSLVLGWVVFKRLQPAFADEI